MLVRCTEPGIVATKCDQLRKARWHGDCNVTLGFSLVAFSLGGSSSRYTLYFGCLFSAQKEPISVALRFKDPPS